MNQMSLKHVSDSSVLTVWVFWRDCNSAHCLVNKPLSTDIFPSSVKAEREREREREREIWFVTLINVLKHFRPVSNLPFVSRLMEKIVLDLFMENSIKYMEMNWYCLKLPRWTMKWWQNHFWRHYDKTIWQNRTTQEKCTHLYHETQETIKHKRFRQRVFVGCKKIESNKRRRK